ncbi:uncharacterized protein YALI1_B11729g [Yarrowia lipolytica]|uniref:Uncharacterized protein n=1 Tax=Yarrowia lipolytica TaxID=4952 RepID=A0A1D8N729_YARLL|nr:hypothetical protein YALI1_B11729g [Yarrowia lipolytica]
MPRQASAVASLAFPQNPRPKPPNLQTAKPPNRQTTKPPKSAYQKHPIISTLSSVWRLGSTRQTEESLRYRRCRRHRCRWRIIGDRAHPVSNQTSPSSPLTAAVALHHPLLATLTLPRVY